MSTGSYQLWPLCSLWPFVSSRLDSAEGTLDPVGDPVLFAVFRIFLKTPDDIMEIMEYYFYERPGLRERYNDCKYAVKRVLCHSEDCLEENDKPLTPKEEAEKFLQDLMEALSTEAVLAKLQFLQGVMVENPSMMRALDDPPGELMCAALVCKNQGLWSKDCAKAFQKVFVPLKVSRGSSWLFGKCH